MSSAEPAWIRASSSVGDGTWVEVRRQGDVIQVRDGKDPGGTVLSFTPAEWAAWLDGASKGEFDHLV
jgi:hypothetical protein